MRWTEESRRQHSEKLRGRKRPEYVVEKLRGPRKPVIDRFLGNARTVAILGEGYILSADECTALDQWFSTYPVDKSYEWFEQLARWLKMKELDLVGQRRKLESVSINTCEAYIIKYGAEEGMLRHGRAVASRPNVWTTDYWQKQGLSAEDAALKVIDIQQANSARSCLLKREHGRSREFSARCVEFYRARGLDDVQAAQALGRRQRRDLGFFIARYGEVEGTIRYQKSKLTRRDTWETKDRASHALSTLPRSYNENGQEMRAIRLFIEQNDLAGYRCVYGPARDQFTAFIPGVGYRRYDLAVFDGDLLLIVFEYHGPAHVNFSSFDESLRHERVRDETGKILPYGSTYGEVYENDRVKRDFIMSNYPAAEYLVAWLADLKRKDLKIATLRTRLQDRIPTSVL